MHARVKELIRRIDRLKDIYNFSDDAFYVVYGSYPTGIVEATSDIDLFIVNKEYDRKLFYEAQKIVTEVHREFSIPLDEEVPFENKLIATFEELEKASRLNGMDMKDGAFVVPDLIRTEAYFGSEQIKLRLLFNAFSTPHYILWENDYYRLIKSKIIESLFWLAIDFLNTDHCTLDEIRNILFTDNKFRCGEEYLGYKSYPKVIQKMDENILDKAFYLNQSGTIVYDREAREVKILDTSALEDLKKEFIGSSKVSKDWLTRNTL